MQQQQQQQQELLASSSLQSLSLSPPSAPSVYPTVGLVNTANSCYLNSLLQVYHSLPFAFHAFLHRLCEDGQRWSKSGNQASGECRRSFTPFEAFRQNPQQALEFVQRLRLFMDHMLLTREVHSSAALDCNGPEFSLIRKLFDGHGRQHNEGKMQDAQEVHSTIWVTIKELGEMMSAWSGNPSISSMWNELFMLRYRYLHRDCEDSTSTVLSLAIVDPTTDEPLDSVSAALGLHCNPVEVSQALAFTTLPTCLVLQLRRFFYRRQDKAATKLEHAVHIDPLLRLPSLLPCVNQCYQLHSVVEHVGSQINNGHYRSYIRVEDGWLGANDHIIERHEESNESFKESAYLLFYVKMEPPTLIASALDQRLNLTLTIATREKMLRLQSQAAADQSLVERQRTERAKKMKSVKEVVRSVGSGYLPLPAVKRHMSLNHDEIENVLHRVQLDRKARGKIAVDSAGGYHYQTAVSLFMMISLCIQPQSMQRTLLDIWKPTQQWERVMEEGVDDIDVWSKDKTQLLLIQCKWRVQDSISLTGGSSGFFKHILHHLRIAARWGDLYQNDVVAVRVEYWTQENNWQSNISSWQEARKKGTINNDEVSTMQDLLMQVLKVAKLDAQEHSEVKASRQRPTTARVSPSECCSSWSKLGCAAERKQAAPAATHFEDEGHRHNTKYPGATR